MTAIILSGGKATRLHGYDKAFLKIGKEFLIHRQLRLLKKIFKNIIIVTHSLEKYKKIKTAKIITDVIPGLGPLGGIYSGLLASRDKYNFVVACDMPFIKPSLIEYILDKRKGYDIVVPRIDGKFHPLFGLYSKACIPQIKRALKKNKLQIRGIFSKLNVYFLSREKLEKIDPCLFSLININTPQELKRVKKLNTL